MLVLANGTDSLNGWPRGLLFVLNLKKLGPIELCLDIIIIECHDEIGNEASGLGTLQTQNGQLLGVCEMTAAGNSFGEVALNAF